MMQLLTEPLAISQEHAGTLLNPTGAVSMRGISTFDIEIDCKEVVCMGAY